MLKKIKLFSALIGCILLAGCCSDKSCSVVLLGTNSMICKEQNR